MTQKIVRVGDLLAITLPNEFLDANGLQIGDEVDVLWDNVRKVIVVKAMNVKA